MGGDGHFRYGSNRVIRLQIKAEDPGRHRGAVVLMEGMFWDAVKMKDIVTR
jgi:hypothetical protein